VENMKYGLSEETYNKIKSIINKYNKYEFKIFGSRARGDYKTNSDIDIAIIDFVEDIEKFEIKNEFDLLDIPYSIDLIFVQDITKQEFLDSIKREGIKYE